MRAYTKNRKPQGETAASRTTTVALGSTAPWPLAKNEQPTTVLLQLSFGHDEKTTRTRYTLRKKKNRTVRI